MTDLIQDLAASATDCTLRAMKLSAAARKAPQGYTTVLVNTSQDVSAAASERTPGVYNFQGMDVATVARLSIKEARLIASQWNAQRGGMSVAKVMPLQEAYAGLAAQARAAAKHMREIVAQATT